MPIDETILDLTSASLPLAGSDRFVVVQNVATTPVTKEITKSDLESELSGGGLTSGPQSFGDNYVITPSIAANNLTVALKTVAGTDPSSTDKISIRIGNTKRSITAAISTTKAAGTNWCNAGSSELAAQDVDFFVYLIQETGASAGTKIGFSRIPWAKTMGDFVNTSTSEKYIAGNWTNFNGTDEVECIGRFRARNSGSASYNWSIPAALIINRPIYETDILTWTPTVVGYTGAVTVTAARYQIKRYAMPLKIIFTGTSNNTATNCTLPFTAKNVAGYWQYGSLGYYVDNGTDGGPGVAEIGPNTSIMNFRKSGYAVWTASGTKSIFTSGDIEIG